jgi:dynein heavy chain 1
MNRTAESIKNPLFRFFDRENQIGRSLLKKIRQDLEDIKKVCDGELKQTNHLRMLLSCLTKGKSLNIVSILFKGVFINSLFEFNN